MELIGIPHRIIISEKNIKNDKIEYSSRRDDKKLFFSLENIVKNIKMLI